MRTIPNRAVAVCALALCVSSLGCAGSAAHTMPTHDEARVWLGLGPGAVLHYSFEATIETTEDDGVTRAVTSHGAYSEKVLTVEHAGEFTVIKMMREVQENAADDDDWTVHRRSGPIYYIIGGEARVHEAVPPNLEGYARTHLGRAVYVQRDTIELREIANTWMAYVLPLRQTTMWHAHPDGRDLARQQQTTQGIRTVPNAPGPVETPAGSFEDCWKVETPGIRTRTTVWTCQEVGMVRASPNGARATRPS